MSDPNCIFCKIVRGEIPCKKLYEDEELLAFHDIQPLAPVHVLIIPKLHVDSLAECDASHRLVLGKMLLLAPKIAREQGATDGFRSIVQTGRVGGQEVYHLHMHVLGGPQKLPPMIPRA
jgi:histidine triad (HIT) family protein